MTDTAPSESQPALDDRSPGSRWVGEAGAEASRGAAPISVARSVALFALAGAVAWLLLAVAGALLFRSIAREEAVKDAERFARLSAESIFAPRLTPAVLDGNPRAIVALDRGRARAPPSPDRRHPDHVWAPDGRIVYSDEPRLLDSRYTLGEDEREVLEHGGVDAEVSDLAEPENRFERGRGELVEVYTRVRATDGRPLLFEGTCPRRRSRPESDGYSPPSRPPRSAPCSCSRSSSFRSRGRSPGGCATARRSARRSSGTRSSPPTTSAGGSPRTSTTASSRTSPDSPSA